MDSYTHVIYVIEPRPELADRLQDALPHVANFLMRPPSYYTQEKDDPTWLEADRLLKMKLVFLNSLHSDPLKNQGDYAALFGSTAISEALFDQWFTIQRHQAIQDLSWIERWLAYTEEPVGTTRSARVDLWLARLRERANKPAFHGSVRFHSPGELQISPLVTGYWERPIIEVLESSGAVSRFGGLADDACSGFIGWCHAKNTFGEGVFVRNTPGALWPEEDGDPFEWYDKVMAEVAGWEEPPYLVNLDEFIITHRDEVLWPPEKRGQERPKAPRSTRPGSPFLWGWYGKDLGDFRSGKGTYTCYSYESLPPLLVPLDGSFRWLRAAPKQERSIGAIQKAAVKSLLAENPPGLPVEFIKFMRSPALWSRIRSCTDCYLSLDPASTAIPGGLGRLLRFLSDSQDCIHWHIHVSQCETKHTVVATYHFTGIEHGGKPHPRDITICAGSFEEFMYRFWLENEIWFALNSQGPMPKYGKEYLAHYRSV